MGLRRLAKTCRTGYRVDTMSSCLYCGRPDATEDTCPSCNVQETCPDCGRRRANQFDEAACNTGECGCPTARALCWYRWNGNRCLPLSIYDPSHREAG